MTTPAFAPSPFFAFRTPVLPFDVYAEWARGERAPSAVDDPDRLAEAVAVDVELQRRRLREIVSRPEIREALFLASPDLDQAIESWLREPEGDKGRRAERALVKYVSRMASRATPFGLFAGTSVGRIGDRTRLAVGPAGAGRRRSRLDADYVIGLSEAFGNEPGLRRTLPLRPNTTLYPAGGRMRYVESRPEGTEVTYHLVSVEDTPELRAVLERAEHGATLDELVPVLVSGEVSREEAEGFLLELVGEQVLVPRLGASLTGPEPAEALARTLRGLPGSIEQASRLDEALRGLAELDEAGPGADPGRYRALAAGLEGLLIEPSVSRLFQVDLVGLSSAATLGEEVLAEIRRGIEALHRMMPPRGSDLRDFRDAFDERYGQREVPLVEALDEESGIGYPAHAEEDSSDGPLLKGLPFPEVPTGTTRWGARETHLLKLLSFALSAGEDEIVLGESDLRELENPAPLPLPGAFAALVRVAARSDEALDRGDFRVVLESAGGPSGARFLGRFCHADPELLKLVEEHLRAEEALDPDAVFAEIVHLPEGRSGNVVRRPLFREYEIPYLGESGAPLERQIPITDLLVSVRGDEIRLRSRRLGRRVVPRLTAAHNYVAYGLCVYRFLCALQAQRSAGGILWDWGALGDAPFLPRVRVGRTVLSAARWVVGKDELSRLAAPTRAERFRGVASWRLARRLPRYVFVSHLAEELLIDFDAVLSVDAFAHLAKSSERVELKEMLPGSDELLARGPEGRFVHEALVPYVCTSVMRPEGARNAGSASAIPAGNAVRRAFLPGSGWLYAKFYGGSVTLDRVLRDTLGPLGASLVASGVADRWFFVRYADPRTHLRLRLRGDARRLREEALPAVEEAGRRLVEGGLSWRMQLDTYEPEVERYGGPEGLDVAERVFHQDSDSVVELLGMLEDGFAGEEERWRLAVLGTDFLMADLGLAPAERRDLVRGLRRAFGEEHHEEAALRRALGARWRELRVEMGALLERTGASAAALEPGIEVLQRRSARLAPLITEVRGLAAAGRLGQPEASLTASHVHMFLNRLLASAQRRQELVVYELLLRGYAALQSKADGQNSPMARPRDSSDEAGKKST